MCTATWTTDTEGLHFFFNRDERRSRPQAKEPFRWNIGKIPFWSPQDPEGGGTWIGVSEAGFIVALLNFYPPGWRPEKEYHSRGILVAETLDQSSASLAANFVNSLNKNDFPPFSLLILDLKQVYGYQWNARELNTIDLKEGFFTSSGYEPEKIFQYRLNLFRQIKESKGITPRSLREFHRSKSPLGGTHSIFMNRHDARTVSISEILLGSAKVFFRYHSWFPEKEESLWEKEFFIQQAGL